MQQHAAFGLSTFAVAAGIVLRGHRLQRRGPSPARRRRPRVFAISRGQAVASEPEAIELEGAESPLGFGVDDRGHIFVSDRGVLSEDDEHGREVNRSRFAGFPGGSNVEVLRSFSNFDPATMTGPAHRNVLPEDSAR